MTIEKESDRPALKLDNRHFSSNQYWVVYNPETKSYGNAGYFYDNALDAECFETIEDAKAAISDDGYGPESVPAFVEITAELHY